MMIKNQTVAMAALALLSLSPLTVSAGSIDAGHPLYDSRCASCHARPWQTSASVIQRAINKNKGGMGYLSVLTATDVDDIATYMKYPNSNDTDRLLDWAETQFPTLLLPHATTQNFQGYTVRYYTASNVYAGSKDGRAYLYDGRNPGLGWQDLGTLRYWLQQAGL